MAADHVPLLGRRLVGAISADQYPDDYSHDALVERLAVAWVRSHGLDGRSALVWSADSWTHLLGDLHPAVPTPAIYMAAYWLGASGLIRQVERSRPELVILTDAVLPSYGRIQPILKRDYRQVEVPRYGSLWLRDGVHAKI